MAEIRITGTVQGVGFRPCVWLLARKLKLSGKVYNDGAGVMIQLYPADAADRLIEALKQALPPLARIDSISIQLTEGIETPQYFQISRSSAGPIRTHLPPDIATCPQCLKELRDPRDRHFRYPFINCTHCGPRYSIVRQLPYDRAQTSMAEFRLCPDCQHQYNSPSDRRFHAQPTACPRCGPHAWLCNSQGQKLATSNAISTAAQLLLQGKLLAIKSIGGFHLACDALNASAISQLRQAKQRPHKPLAVLMRDIAQVETFCRVSEKERKQLQSPAAPIVLLQLKAQCELPQSLAPGLNRFGVMLVANPLQHLLMDELDRPIVMTSGNISGEPPCTDNQQALELLGPQVDALLLHNRPIVRRVDDSLLQCTASGVQVLRRGRGLAPSPLKLPHGFESAEGVFALGGDIKNAPALLHHGFAVAAPHLGDLSRVSIANQCRQTLREWRALFDCPPKLIACDAHPGYISRRLADALASEFACPVVSVSHHHAHLAACLAENSYPASGKPVLGLILDGLGFAPDSQHESKSTGHSLWGGEFLLANYSQCQHLGGLPAVALPGGEQASLQPWRNLLAHLDQFVPEWPQIPLPALQRLKQQPVPLLRQAMASNINSPRASSCGRLFDAVAALLGLCFAQQSYEGQAAMLLQAQAEQAETLQDTPLTPTNVTRLWLSLLADLQHNQPVPSIALAFHQRLAAMLSHQMCQLAAKHQTKTLVLSGGCLQNRLLLELLVKQLQAARLNVLLPSQFPANDGGLALGQAVIACQMSS